MMNWPVLLKSVSRLGNSEQQGRLFGFFETGRGIVDTVVAFSALAVFTWFGSGLLGFKAGIWFYSLIVIAVGIIIFFVLNDKEEAPSVEVKKEDGASQHTSMTSVLKDKLSGLSLSRLLRLRGLLWPDILHSIPEKHLSIARCAGGGLRHH
ncbi:major facilitator superfamily protein [Escherichia coli]|uniref:Major facilitator superfamily protein n=1 Tax=Escherichia coli TaxID=562 RepID=A0A376YJ27_ECOLX|nr:major facilitator superfamily protein [Escherichia coli]